MFRWIFLTFAFCSMASATCLPQSSNSSITPSGWRVYQNTSCPTSNSQASYKYFPETICSPVQMPAALTSTWTGGGIMQSIWANRWNGGHNKKPNPPSGAAVSVNDGVHGAASCFLAYTSQANSNAATYSEVAYAIGRASTTGGSNGWLDYTRAVSIPDASVYDYASFTTNASTLCSTWSATYAVYYATDIVVEPSAKLADVPNIPQLGVEIDYEPQDSRSTSDTNTFFATVAANVQGLSYRLALYTNPLDGLGGTPYNGISSANVDYILTQVDEFGIYVIAAPVGKSPLQSLTDQMAEFTSPPYSKFNLMADMSMALSDAQAVRAAVTSTYPFGGVNIVINGQTVCTTTYNDNLKAFTGVP